jgi:hypothetical protein
MGAAACAIELGSQASRNAIAGKLKGTVVSAPKLSGLGIGLPGKIATDDF